MLGDYRSVLIAVVAVMVTLFTMLTCAFLKVVNDMEKMDSQGGKLLWVYLLDISSQRGFIDMELNDYAEKNIGVALHCSGGLFVARESVNTVPKQYQGSSRGDIKTFSVGASVRMRKYLRGCVADYKNMITLTYPHSYSVDGRVIKEHLRRFLQEMKRDSDRRGYFGWSAFWFLEFQKRGAPHFHIFITHGMDKNKLSKLWYEICGTEDKRHLACGTKIEKLRNGKGGMCSYASKYALKQEQKTVPSGYDNVGRFWGISGVRYVVSADTFVTIENQHDRAIKGVLIRLKNEINKALVNGTAWEIEKNKELMIVNIMDKRVTRKVQELIGRLGSLCMVNSTIFVQDGNQSCDNSILLDKVMA